MKKKLKKLAIPLFLVGALVTSINLANEKNLNIKEFNNEIAFIDAEALLQEEEFINAYENELIKTYGENYKEIISQNNLAAEKAQSIEALFSKSRSGETMYPEYFGGVYINDNQDLIVQFVEEKIPDASTTQYSTYNSIINLSNKSDIEYVDYSLTELNNINNAIIDYFSSDNSTYTNLRANYIDIINNKVVVELINYNEEEIESFKNQVIDSDLIVFKQGEKVVTALNAGQAMTKNGELMCTIGYRAKLAGTSRTGFVTAGHCTTGIGQDLHGYGTVQKRQKSGGVDAAWVETSQTLTNNLQYGVYPATKLATSDAPTNVTVGQIVGKVGGKTNGSSGKVTNTSYSESVFDTSEYKYIYYTNLVATNLYTGRGDSGGVVFSNSSTATVLGIVMAAHETEDNYMLFSKADLIKTSLGITRY